jgi:hypothetical protein
MTLTPQAPRVRRYTDLVVVQNLERMVQDAFPLSPELVSKRHGDEVKQMHSIDGLTEIVNITKDGGAGGGGSGRSHFRRASQPVFREVAHSTASDMVKVGAVAAAAEGNSLITEESRRLSFGGGTSSGLGRGESSFIPQPHARRVTFVEVQKRGESEVPCTNLEKKAIGCESGGNSGCTGGSSVSLKGAHQRSHTLNQGRQLMGPTSSVLTVGPDQQQQPENSAKHTRRATVSGPNPDFKNLPSNRNVAMVTAIPIPQKAAHIEGKQQPSQQMQQQTQPHPHLLLQQQQRSLPKSNTGQHPMQETQRAAICSASSASNTRLVKSATVGSTLSTLSSNRNAAGNAAQPQTPKYFYPQSSPQKAPSNTYTHTNIPPPPSHQRSLPRAAVSSQQQKLPTQQQKIINPNNTATQITNTTCSTRPVLATKVSSHCALPESPVIQYVPRNAPKQPQIQQQHLQQQAIPSRSSLQKDQLGAQMDPKSNPVTAADESTPKLQPKQQQQQQQSDHSGHISTLRKSKTVYTIQTLINTTSFMKPSSSDELHIAQPASEKGNAANLETDNDMVARTPTLGIAQEKNLNTQTQQVTPSAEQNPIHGKSKTAHKRPTGTYLDSGSATEAEITTEATTKTTGLISSFSSSTLKRIASFASSGSRNSSTDSLPLPLTSKNATNTTVPKMVERECNNATSGNQNQNSWKQSQEEHGIRERKVSKR